MSRAPLVLASVAAVVLPSAAGSAGPTPPSPIQPRLDAKVSAHSISLTNAAGARVQTLYQESYRFVVHDSSKGQNFHLIGPAVNRKTGVAAKTTTTWTVMLEPGTYVFRSDRSSRLHGSFGVKSGPPPANP